MTPNQSPEGGETAVEAHPEVAREAALAYFNAQSVTGRGWLLKRADRGDAITIPTTQHGDIVLTGADFLKAVAHD